MNFRKNKTNELNRLNKNSFQTSEKSGIYIIIDNLRSGLNIGSIFRTADAFRIEKIYISGISPTPPNKEIMKTALGSTENINWEYITDVIEVINKLKAENIKIFAVEQTQNSIYLNDFEINDSIKLALIFGNEIDGVNQDAINLCDGVIEIPQFGTKHSLNVAVSAGIVLWQIASNRLLNI
ncbi:MAG: RNA methyltransferase [Bacteroidia bacterium]